MNECTENFDQLLFKKVEPISSSGVALTKTEQHVQLMKIILKMEKGKFYFAFNNLYSFPQAS